MNFYFKFHLKFLIWNFRFEFLCETFLWNLGYETSSTTLTYCMYELSINTDIQRKARDSVKGVLKKHGNKLTYEAVNEMQYLEQCVNGELCILRFFKFLIFFFILWSYNCRSAQEISSSWDYPSGRQRTLSNSWHWHRSWKRNFNHCSNLRHPSWPRNLSATRKIRPESLHTATSQQPSSFCFHAFRRRSQNLHWDAICGRWSQTRVSKNFNQLWFWSWSVQDFRATKVFSAKTDYDARARNSHQLQKGLIARFGCKNEKFS